MIIIALSTCLCWKEKLGLCSIIFHIHAMTGNICSASLRVLANLLRIVSAIIKKTTKGGFPVIAQTSRSHVFTKEINHASTRSQYLNGNFYCKNRLRVFSAMTGKPALRMDDFILFSALKGKP